MWSAKPPKEKMNLKDTVAVVQSIATIIAMIIGGGWTYDLFIKERKEYPLVNIGHSISHVSVSDNINVLRVAIDVTNTGSAQMVIGKYIIRIQQVLPLHACQKPRTCVANEVNDAVNVVEQKNDKFTWPLLAERTDNFSDSKGAISVEPGEKPLIEFEFAIPSNIEVVRIYSYLRNEKLRANSEIGWSASDYYDLRATNQKRAKSAQSSEK